MTAKGEFTQEREKVHLPFLDFRISESFAGFSNLSDMR
jgi:hypothetical protein